MAKSNYQLPTCAWPALSEFFWAPIFFSLALAAGLGVSDYDTNNLAAGGIACLTLVPMLHNLVRS